LLKFNKTEKEAKRQGFEQQEIDKVIEEAM
jgi:hypothetical protein